MPSRGGYANIATGAGTLLLAVASFGATQRAITRFSLVPRGDDAWTCEVVKYGNLDRPDPR